MSTKIYPQWWDKSITLYNKYTDATTGVISWYRTTINDCFWKKDTQKISVGNTILESNDTLVRIRENAKFKPKEEWVKLPNDNMSKYFTLGVGDIIIFGKVDDIIDEYAKGHRANDIVTKYKDLQGCIEIQSVTINTGKYLVAPHYYVRGV